MANDRNDALRDYVEVNVRIERFWAKYPNGRIETKVTFLENTQPQEVIVKTNVYRDISDTFPAATGHAHEVFGSSYINRTSFIENAETSSIGRAIAILGFEIKKSVASREEVANAQAQQAQAQQAQPAPQPAPVKPTTDTASDAQVKMLNAKLGACGYTKGDVETVLKMLSEFLGYKVTKPGDVKKADVNRLAEYLTNHKKAV